VWVSNRGAIGVDRGKNPAPGTVATELGLVGRIAVIGIVIAGAAVVLPGGLLLFIPFAIVGTLLAIRRPQTSIGWILLALGWVFALLLTPIDASAKQFAAMIVSWPVGLLAVAQGAAAPASFVLLALLAVVYPSGRIPTGRWGTAVRVGLVICLLLVLHTAVYPVISVSLAGQSTDSVVRNPGAVLPNLQLWQLLGPGTTIFPCMAFALAAVISLVVRYRGAQRVERQQIRWLAAALAAVVLGVVSGFVIGYYLVPGSADSGVAWVLVLLAVPCVPIAIGIAVLRYRLYEIDTIINRALLYGSVTVLLLAAFGIANIGLQRILESLTGQRSDVLTAGLGIGAAVAYGPMRRWLRPLVDRLLPGRALLTLLFTDIVGSTERIVDLGDERWRVLLGRYRAAVRQELARKRGREVDTAGDAFFATFDRPSAGVSCALAIHSAVEEIGLQARTGVHLGECEMRGEKVSGIEVHAASRIMAAAADGEILLSGAVRDVIGDAEFPTADRGDHQLKGVPGDWRLYALEPVRQHAAEGRRVGFDA
jgi:class 3 adenylate cyclase